MENLKEYLNEAEEIKIDNLNEDAVMVALATLAFPTVAALTAWGGSLLIYGYSKIFATLTNKVINNWKGIINNIRSIGRKDVVDTMRSVKHDPAVKKQIVKTEKAKGLYEEELKDVILAIEGKNWNLAKVELLKQDKSISDNPEVQKIIISEIVKMLKQPPIYIASPGNPAYQAIKKVLNIRVARAAAAATKAGLENKLGIEEDKKEDK